MSADELGIRTATASLDTGTLSNSEAEAGPEADELRDLAAAMSEMLTSHDVDWDLLFSESADSTSVQRIVLISDSRMYVGQRYERQQESCHLGLASREQSVGFALSQAKVQFAAREAGTQPGGEES